MKRFNVHVVYKDHRIDCVEEAPSRDALLRTIIHTLGYPSKDANIEIEIAEIR